MAVKLFNTRVKLKNDSKTNWTNASLVLLPGEIAIDNTNYNFKIGDGTKTFDQLDYVIGGAKLAGWTTDTSSNTAITASDTLETALHKLENKVDSAVSGGVTDVQIGGTSIVTDHVANFTTEGTYNSSNNKIATESTVTNAIAALDGSITGTPGAGKTPVVFSQTDGVVTASFADISITASQISDLSTSIVTSVKGDGTYLEPSTASSGAVTISHKTITQGSTTSTGTVGSTNTGTTGTFTVPTVTVDGAGHVTSTDTKTITVTFPSASDLGLTSAMHFVGSGTTLPASGTSGDVFLNTSTHKEYVYDGTNWVELGDEGSYALKTVTITAGDLLTGGGTLEANRTISHATVTAPTSPTPTSKVQGNSVTAITELSEDGFGHVTSYKTDQFTIPVVNTHSLSIGTEGAYNTYNPSVQGSTNQIVTIAGSGPISATSDTGASTTITISHDGPGAQGADITAVTTTSALKVAYDAKGHITSSEALTATDVTRTATASIAATTVEGALQELATAIASGTDGNLITTNTTVQTPGSESMSNDINLHKISKTANPADLIQPTGDMIIFDCGSASVNTGTETGAIESNASTPNA